MPLARLRANGLLAGGLGGFEQHVGSASGQGARAKARASEQKLQARFSSVGKIERCCEKLPKPNAK